MAVNLRLSLKENSYNIDNNTSNVTIKCYIVYTYGSYNKNKCYGDISIGGTYFDDFAVSFNWNQSNSGEELAWEYTGNFAHNNDGKKTLNVTAYFESGVSSGDITKTGSLVLTDIPRAGSIVSAPNFTDEGNPTITYSNPAGNSAVVSACISLDGSKDDIAYRTIPATGSSYTFNLTEAERNVLRNACTTANSRTVRFYVKTVIGSNTYLSDLPKTLTIVNAHPTITPTIKDTNATTIALTGDANKLIRYYSNAAVTIGAKALKGASIKSQKVVNGSKSFTNASGTITGSDNNTFKFTATDSRGNTTNKTVIQTTVNYVKLTCNIGGNTPDTQGNFSFTVKGNYFAGNFGAVSNTLQVYYRYKSDGDYGEWIAMTPSLLEGHTYSAVVNLTGLDYQTTYTFQAYAIDKLATVYTDEKPIKASPVFDWSENDFNVNVDFNIRGKGVLRVNEDNNNTVLSAEDAENGVFIRPNGTGSQDGQVYFTTDNKMQTEAGFMVRGKDSSNNVMNALEFYDSSNNMYINHGGYTVNKGTTYLRGNNVAIQSKNNVTINGKTYGVNQILWGDGGYYMTSEHKIPLSQAVSNQAHGIVLVFSYFSGSAQNYYFQSFFIPKQLISEQTGFGHTFVLAGTNFNPIGTKYLYIGNEVISGNDNNNKSGTTNGITYNNAAFVLRYVIGV